MSLLSYIIVLQFFLAVGFAGSLLKKNACLSCNEKSALESEVDPELEVSLSRKNHQRKVKWSPKPEKKELLQNPDYENSSTKRVSEIYKDHQKKGRSVTDMGQLPLPRVDIQARDIFWGRPPTQPPRNSSRTNRAKFHHLSQEDGNERAEPLLIKYPPLMSMTQRRPGENIHEIPERRLRKNVEIQGRPLGISGSVTHEELLLPLPGQQPRKVTSRSDEIRKMKKYPSPEEESEITQPRKKHLQAPEKDARICAPQSDNDLPFLKDSRCTRALFPMRFSQKGEHESLEEVVEKGDTGFPTDGKIFSLPKIPYKVHASPRSSVSKKSSRTYSDQHEPRQMHLQKPYTLVPPEGPLEYLSQTRGTNKLSETDENLTDYTTDPSERKYGPKSVYPWIEKKEDANKDFKAMSPKRGTDSSDEMYEDKRYARYPPSRFPPDVQENPHEPRKTHLQKPYMIAPPERFLEYLSQTRGTNKLSEADGQLTDYTTDPSEREYGPKSIYPWIKKKEAANKDFKAISPKRGTDSSDEVYEDKRYASYPPSRFPPDVQENPHEPRRTHLQKPYMIAPPERSVTQENATTNSHPEEQEGTQSQYMIAPPERSLEYLSQTRGMNKQSEADEQLTDYTTNLSERKYGPKSVHARVQKKEDPNRDFKAVSPKSSTYSLDEVYEDEKYASHPPSSFLPVVQEDHYEDEYTDDVAYFKPVKTLVSEGRHRKQIATFQKPKQALNRQTRQGQVPPPKSS